VSTPEQVERLLDQVTRWAAVQPDMRAVALVGSHARGKARPDSDLDLVLLSNDPQVHFLDTRWARRFGPIARQQTESYGPVTSLRVWYEDGLEVEFGFAAPGWAALPLDEGTRQVMADGMRILWERRSRLLSGAMENLAGRRDPVAAGERE
jgi:hypothetical protein